ncbi:MAG: glycosyltransferase family 39 protein [Chloroflexota bacterium]|nr:glycosyltransferase family 39 protein [Chloroflexota bacterium]
MDALVNRLDVRLALALFCLLTCLYSLTSGAHIDSTDGETVYLVTEGLVERGTFAQLEPEQAGDSPRSVVRAYNGNLYAVTGPLQSLLTVPFYLVGSWVARAFSSPFYTYFTRFFVALFNSPVCAATAALLYLISVDLGYRRRTALFVTLTYGLATVAWPYAHSFFAETLHTFWLVLAVWAAYRYTHTEHWGWVVLVGITMGLGVATKYVMAVAAPAFALYLLLDLRQRNDRCVRYRRASRTVLAGGLPFLLIIGILMTFNYARFGSLLETGYTSGDPGGAVGAWATTATPLVSWYGYFFSSGKGFLFFSPPALLALWGVPALARRRCNETWLLLALAAAYPLFYSLVKGRWFGGANWGPRYIVCITPFVILLLGAFLERHDVARWLRVGSATLLFTLGFWVQMSTIFVNYNIHLFSDVPFERQLFYPADSTLSAQWRLWPRQVKAWQQYDHDLRASGQEFYVIDGGFHDVELPDLAPFGRWMRKSGRLRIYAQPEQVLTIQIAYSRPRLADVEEWSGLHLVYDGAPVIGERRLVAENERETQWVEALTIPADEVHILPGTLEMTATTWIPQSGDPRELSVFVEYVEVSSDDSQLIHKEANLPRPLPVTTSYPWSWQAMFWFYDPANARPFDMWPWYVWTSGLPLPQARTLIIILALVLGGGLVASTIWFISELGRNL